MNQKSLMSRLKILLLAFELASRCQRVISFTSVNEIFVHRYPFTCKHQYLQHDYHRESKKTMQVTPSSSVGTEEEVRQTTVREVVKIEKYSRLPIWPLWNGVFIFLISKIPFISYETVASLEDAIGGRVCPMFFPQDDIMSGGSFYTSPFILLVHHMHTFHPWDPLRYIQRFFFPEGFPSHPHRGFCTLTYCLHGGMIHRDSIGTRQDYGASKDYSTQFLVAGSGILHEEMWDTERDSKQELFQLWLNLPAKYKMMQPSIQLLADRQDSMPTVVDYIIQGQNSCKQSSTLIIAGSYERHQSNMTLFSNVTILHVKLFQIPSSFSSDSNGKAAQKSIWRYSLPENYRTVILYTRSGSINIAGTHIPPHHTVFISQKGEDLIVSLDLRSSHTVFSYPAQVHEPKIGADFIVLAGEPLINEPVVAQGSFVMNSYEEITQAFQDYEKGLFGVPWKETLSDDEWRLHVDTYTSKGRKHY